MQVEDTNKRIIVSEEIDLLHIPERLGSIIQRVNVRKVVVAPMPKEGNVFEINGLKFEVVREMGRKRFLIKMVEAVTLQPVNPYNRPPEI